MTAPAGVFRRAGLESVGQRCDSRAWDESAPPPLGTPALRFSTCRSALAASRRHPDVPPPRKPPTGALSGQRQRRRWQPEAVERADALPLHEAKGPESARSDSSRRVRSDVIRQRGVAPAGPVRCGGCPSLWPVLAAGASEARVRAECAFPASGFGLGLAVPPLPPCATEAGGASTAARAAAAAQAADAAAPARLSRRRSRIESL